MYIMNKSTIRPLKHNIIVKLIENEKEEKKGSLILLKPGNKTKIYEVLCIGDAVNSVEKGNAVMIESHAGYKVEYGSEADETLLLIHEADIIAIVG